MDAQLERLLGECQAAGHRLKETMQEVVDRIEELDPGEENEAAQYIRDSFQGNLLTEVEGVCDALDYPEGL